MIWIKLQILALYFLMFLSTVSCSDNTVEKHTEGSRTAKSPEINQMSIYISNDDAYVADVVRDYNLDNKDTPILVKNFTYNNSDEIKEVRNKVTAELMAGHGPDIIITYETLFPSIARAVNSEVFYDLNKLIDQDKEFKLSDYNQTVLDSGVINGKRYLMPLFYYIPSFWTTEKTLSKNNISLNDSLNWSWSDFFSEANKFMQKNKEEEKYFVGYYFEPRFILTEMCGDLVNVQSKKSSFNTPEFVEFLRNYKENIGSICPNNEMVKQKGYTYNYIKSGSLVFVNSVFSIHPALICNTNSMLLKGLNDNIVIINKPVLDKVFAKSAYSGYLAGINAKCKSKEKAFEFIKLMISEKYQSDPDSQCAGTPVNLEAYKTAVNNCLRSDTLDQKAASPWFLGLNAVDSVPLSDKVVKNIDDISGNITSCNIIDYNIVQIAADGVTEYLNGKMSAESAAKSINEKILLYLNE